MSSREAPTREIRTVAAVARSYPLPDWGRSYLHIQMLTVVELLRRASIAILPAHGTSAQAPWAMGLAAQQGTLELE